MKKAEIIEEGTAAIEAVKASPALAGGMDGLLQLAITEKGSIDVIERLAKLYSEERDKKAESDFNDSLSRCQQKLTRVARDMENPQTHSRYASYAALDRVVRPVYTDEGVSISFSEDDSSAADYIVMLAFVSRGGYTRKYRKGMPVVTKGPQGKEVMTATHASGSAASYAKRYLLKQIFNLAEGEDDNDGNIIPKKSEGVVTEIHPAVLDEWLLGMRQATTMRALQGIFGLAYKTAKDSGDARSLKQITAVYEEAKVKLQ